MRISEVFSILKSYLPFAVIFVVAVLLVICAGYELVYRRLLHGKRKLYLWGILGVCVTLCYLCLVLGVTILRGSVYGGTSFVPFSSYREAMVSFEARTWRYLILNILMFVPVGFLLPAAFPWFRHFLKTYLAGLLLSVGIEVCQFFLHRGICETDDVINNLLGTMIGYGFYKIAEGIFCTVVKLIRPERKGRFWRGILLSQLPLFLSAFAFIFIFASYYGKELGNLSFVSEYVGDDFYIGLTNYHGNLSEREHQEMVYQAKRYTVGETKKEAEKFFERIGEKTDKSRTDVMDDTVAFYSKGTPEKILWIGRNGGTLWYTGEEEGFPEAGKTETPGDQTVQTTADVVREKMKKFGVTVPDGIRQQSAGEGEQKGVSFTADYLKENDILYHGTLSCSFDEKGEITEFSDYIIPYQPYKKFTVISEKEAYKELLRGNFAIKNGAVEREHINRLFLMSLETGYEEDSKHFMQPVWLFTGKADGKDIVIEVKAVK